MGVVLYEMLTGQRPFRGDYDQAVVYSILNEEPKPVAALNPEVPEPLAQVVEKLLAKDPAERYQRAEDLLPDLKALRSADTQSVPLQAMEAAPVVPSMWRWVRKSEWGGFAATQRPITPQRAVQTPPGTAAERWFP